MLRATYSAGDESFIVQSDDDPEMGQVADLSMNRLHPPMLLAELLGNGGGIWEPVPEDAELPDFSRLEGTTFFDRTRSKPSLGESIFRGDGEPAAPHGTVEGGSVGYKGAAIGGEFPER